MRRLTVALAVFAGLIVLELVLLAFVETTTRPLDRTGEPFRLDNVAPGTAITQRLEVNADGFDGVHLEGTVTPGVAPALLHAEIVELDDQRARVVRTSSVQVPASSTDCCTFRFEPVADSRFRAYRLDVMVGDLNGRQLSLRAAPGPVNGRFAINGRFQRAFLLFTTSARLGTGLDRLSVEPASKTMTLAWLALFYNAAVVVLMQQLLVSASDPRRA
jgi:hypothetical protein